MIDTAPDMPAGRRRRRRGQGGGGRPGAAGGAWSAPGGTGVLAPSGISEGKRSLIETGLLIALIEESRHGYTLVARVQELVGGQVSVDPGSVYRILRVLEEAGMISSSWEAGVAGPQRRIYTIEPEGRRQLRSWATVLAQRGEALLALAEAAEGRLA